MHGMSEHGGRYNSLAAKMVEEKISVYVPDHRGHGKTAKSQEELGFFSEKHGWANVVKDVRLWVELIRSNYSSLPIFMLGHSMGSYVAQAYLNRFKAADLSGVILSGTSGAPPPIAALGRLIARVERWRLGQMGRSRIIETLSVKKFNEAFAPNRTSFDWLSRDEVIVDNYVNDPLCGFMCTNQLWMDLLDALPGLTKERNVSNVPSDLPIYIFSGSKDSTNNMGKGALSLAENYRKNGIFNIKTKLYEDARHETLNETNRNEVVSDMLTWISWVLENNGNAQT